MLPYHDHLPIANAHSIQTTYLQLIDSIPAVDDASIWSLIVEHLGQVYYTCGFRTQVYVDLGAQVYVDLGAQV